MKGCITLLYKPVAKTVEEGKFCFHVSETT